VRLLALNLVLTPALIAAASLAGRRWGHAVSGWLVGFPWTTRPVVLFVALERGTSFGAAAALGALAATIAEAAFCVAYAYVARRAAWPVALGAATVAFGVVGAGWQKPAVPLIPTAAVVFAALALALWLMPRAVAAASPPPPRWDLPVRMVIATVLVFAITESAAALGPHGAARSPRSRCTPRSSPSSHTARARRRRSRCCAGCCGDSSALPASS
jgi:hypothetical protein